MSTALQLRRRSQLLGTPVFVEGAVERLGFVSQVWVDRHSLRVVGWSIRRDRQPESSLAVTLSASKLLGTGALLLKSDALSAPLKTDAYVRLIPQVLETQAGVSLGRIKDFTFDLASGAISSVQTSGTGIPLLPRALDSTFEIARTDLIANGSLTAAEGAEERLTLLQRGLLEQAGIGKFDWSLPLSAGKAPELDENTLEAIAELAASPLPVETTEGAIPEDATDSTARGDAVEAARTSSEDASTETSDTTAESDKPLDRAIDVLTSTVQPLLLKLPSSLRQRLGLSDAELEATDVQPVEAAISEDDAEDGIEVEADTSETGEPEATEEAVAEEPEDIEESSEDEEVSAVQEDESSPDRDVETASDTASDEPVAESSEEEAVTEPTVAEPTVTEPTVAEPTVAEPTVAEPTVAEPTVAEPTVAELVDVEPEPESVAAEPEAQISEQDKAELDEETVEAEAISETEFVEETEDREDSPEAIAESEPTISEEPDASETSDSPAEVEAELEEGEVSDEAEQPADIHPDDSESDNYDSGSVKPGNGDVRTVTEAAAAISTVATVAGIARSHRADTAENEEPTTTPGHLAPSPVTPPSTAPHPSAESIPPALSTSLPRMPRTTVKTDATETDVKAGTPVHNRVSLPSSRSRVPKAGGSFEPKVKGS